MKKIFLASALIATSLGLSAPATAADVGVSITVGQPGFYGRIDLGDYPRPQLIYAEPVMIERRDYREPIYMRVPPGHAKHWDKHCHEYRACGERVYFVQDSWYTEQYVPYYREHHRGKRDDRQGNDDSDDHGHGHGHGKNKD